MVKSMLLALQQRNSSIKNLPRLLNHFQDSLNSKKLKQTKFLKLLSQLFYQTLIFQHLLVHSAQDSNFLINLLYYIHSMILMPLICVSTLRIYLEYLASVKLSAKMIKDCLFQFILLLLIECM